MANLIFRFVYHSIHTRFPPPTDPSNLQNSASSSLLSPPTSTRRRGSSVMFNEFVILHTPPTIPEPQNDKNALSVEKMTQTGEGIWQVSGIFMTIKKLMIDLLRFVDRAEVWLGLESFKRIDLGWIQILVCWLEKQKIFFKKIISWFFKNINNKISDKKFQF